MGTLRVWGFYVYGATGITLFANSPVATLIAGASTTFDTKNVAPLSFDLEIRPSLQLVPTKTSLTWATYWHSVGKPPAFSLHLL